MFGEIKNLNVFEKPYLIQRGFFRNITLEEVVGLDSLINYDYMGSSEFEFGTLPASLSTIMNFWNVYIVREIPDLKDLDKQSAYIICYNKHTDNVIQIIKKLSTRDGEYEACLKERSDLYRYLKGDLGLLQTNFWWDVKNCWFLCFGIYNLQRLVHALRLVFQKKKGTLPEHGPTEITGKHYRPEQTIIERLGPILHIQQVDGYKTKINLKKIRKVERKDDIVFITVLSAKSNTEKILKIHSKDRAHLIYKAIKNEWAGINKEHEQQK